MTSNPSVCRRPDGGYLMVYKAVGKQFELPPGEVQQFDHLERPQVFIENGEPVALLCAADKRDENNVRHTFNIQIPLLIAKE